MSVEQEYTVTTVVDVIARSPDDAARIGAARLGGEEGGVRTITVYRWGEGTDSPNDPITTAIHDMPENGVQSWQYEMNFSNEIEWADHEEETDGLRG